jgi:hypothetical protein
LDAGFHIHPGTSLVMTTPVALTAADSPPFESQIGALLAELSDVQAELLTVLQQKCERLAALDLPGLAALQPREGELMHRLDACQRRRRVLLAQAAAEGKPGDITLRRAGVAHRSACGKCGDQVKSTSPRMRLLQHHSLANWVLAQRCVLHVSQLLESIATGGRSQPTDGDGDPVHSPGALVNHEA